MKIKFIGAAHEVTGSCHFLNISGKNIIIDCGMEQGADIYENADLPVDAASLDYIFITHAHIDHTGRIPLMYKRGFKGKIFATNATTHLCEIMLKDSAHIQEQETEWKNRKAERAGKPKVEPMYTLQDAVDTMKLFVPCAYDEEIEVCEGIRVCFRDAGHLLGSSFIEMHAAEDGKEISFIFSGDLGNGGRALIRDPEAPGAADYVLIESTYGDRLHDTPPDYAVALAEVLNDTFSRGGNVVIPAFSVGRTQEMLYYMRDIKKRDLVPVFSNFEVWVDSPLSNEATNIFNKVEMECYRDEDKAKILAGENPIAFQGLRRSITSDDSKAINAIKKPIVIISASGMCEAGRIRHHLKHNLWRADSTVVFVGYQVPGTLGFNLLNGATEVKIFGETINVAAKIVNLPGISGHADRDHLIGWLSKMPEKPKHVFVVHGEDEVTDNFAALIREKLGMDASAPYSGDEYDLISGTQTAFGTKKRVAKKTSGGGKVSDAFARLLASGKKLLEVIQSNREGANKDLKKFTSEIDALIEKWSRD